MGSLPGKREPPAELAERLAALYRADDYGARWDEALDLVGELNAALAAVRQARIALVREWHAQGLSYEQMAAALEHRVTRGQLHNIVSGRRGTDRGVLARRRLAREAQPGT